MSRDSVRAVLNLNFQNAELNMPLLQINSENVYETQGLIEPQPVDNYSPGGGVESNSQSVFDITPMNQRYEQQPAKGRNSAAQQVFSNSIFDLQNKKSI